MTALRHILFDNDGTLVDSEILAVRSMLRVLEAHGLRLEEPDYCRRFPGLLERDIVRLLSEEHAMDFPEDFLEKLRLEHGDVFQRELRAIPGMPALFRGLNVPKSVVSNGSRAHVERSLLRVGLLDDLDGAIFSAEQVGKPKPHPDVYAFALERLDLSPLQALVVEDSGTGVEAAKGAGLRVVGFLGAAHIHDGHDAVLRSAGADFIAADAEALRQIFDGFGLLK
jgi:HAD superfamily hydrolase (TIGR01509 family)